MIPTRFDVVILGGGPAGLATALSLRQTNAALAVAVVENSEYERVRIGETLPPSVRPLLEQLQVWEQFNNDGHMPVYAAASAWGSDELQDNEFIYHSYNQAWHLDRRRFDRMLAEQAVARGVHLLTAAAVRDCEQNDTQRWKLAIRADSIEVPALEAEFVVDATGRQAFLAHQQGARKIFFDRLLGSVVFYKLDPDGAALDSSTTIEASESGWWYSAPLPNGQLVVAYMTDDDFAKTDQIKTLNRWNDALQSTRHTSRRVGNAQPLGQPTFHPASSFRLDRISGARWLAVGDAASAVDPLSSHGIFKALRSGIWASYAICDFLQGNCDGIRKYETLIGGEFEDYLKTRWEFYQQERRWESSEFWRRRHGLITLQPLQMLMANESPGHAARLDNLNMNLSSAEFQFLDSLCRTARPVHAIVSEFKEGRRSKIHDEATTDLSDRRIILAIQYLVEQRIFSHCHEGMQSGTC